MKGKLFRLDAKTKSWKERGVGKMKLQEYPQSGKYRLLMRRDQILKVCCNHYLAPDMKISFHLGSLKSLMWFTPSDLSEETARPETFALKFSKAETAQQFKNLFEECVAKLKKDTPKPYTESKSVPNNSEKWTCEQCYVEYLDGDKQTCECCGKKRENKSCPDHKEEESNYTEEETKDGNVVVGHKTTVSEDNDEDHQMKPGSPEDGLSKPQVPSPLEESSQQTDTEDKDDNEIVEDRKEEMGKDSSSPENQDNSMEKCGDGVSLSDTKNEYEETKSHETTTDSLSQSSMPGLIESTSDCSQ